MRKWSGIICEKKRCKVSRVFGVNGDFFVDLLIVISRVEKEQQSAVEYTMEKSEDLKKKIALLENETKGHIVERDQALSDLRNVEQAFSDVHR